MAYELETWSEPVALDVDGDGRLDLVTTRAYGVLSIRRQLHP